MRLYVMMNFHLANFQFAPRTAAVPSASTGAAHVRFGRRAALFSLAALVCCGLLASPTAAFAQAQSANQAGNGTAALTTTGAAPGPQPIVAATPSPAALRPVGGLPAADPAVRRAVQQGQENGGTYPVLGRGMSERVPFGYAKPKLNCQPLRANLIRLEPGERVMSTITGDTENWSIHLTHSGAGGVTPVVVVKPLSEEEVRTNLFVTTDRRIYEIILESKGAAALSRAQEAATSNVLEFYYPDDVVQSWETQNAYLQNPYGPHQAQPSLRYASAAAGPAAGPGGGPVARPVALTPSVDLDRMQFTYEWDREDGFPWQPTSVFDDGAHVYIKLPADAQHEAGAVLFVRGLSGENTLLEYTPRDGLIITDRVFREARFVYSEPSSKKKPKKYTLTIKNTAR